MDIIAGAAHKLIFTDEQRHQFGIGQHVSVECFAFVCTPSMADRSLLSDPAHTDARTSKNMNLNTHICHFRQCAINEVDHFSTCRSFPRSIAGDDDVTVHVNLESVVGCLPIIDGERALLHVGRADDAVIIADRPTHFHHAEHAAISAPTCSVHVFTPIPPALT